MGNFLRDRVIGVLFGNRVDGIAAAAAVVWALDQLEDTKRGQVLDVARLTPGETYTVATRPPPGRKERKLEGRANALSRQIARVEVSPRKVRSAQRDVSAAIARLERAGEGTRAGSKRLRAVTKAEARLVALTAWSGKETKLRTELARHTEELERLRAAALASARSRRRRPLRREFR